ncbi:ROK family protein [Microbacterium sp. ZW T5_56]|uniref:ROK family protein n=1 Tax=Microbacterium sp. ZW T5_56 TaxID=3378081 RepID=UPI003851A999
MELCIDFGGTEIKLAVTADHRVLASRTAGVRGGAEDLTTAASEAHALLERMGARPDAVGIAVPGVVDPTTGRMIHANAKYDHLRDFDLSAWSRREFGVEATVENDARAALIGETTTGSATARDAVLVTLGTGIGTAAMINGIALRGHSGHAGILGGHVTVDLDGPVCPCGNVGCAEACASAWVLRESTDLSMSNLFATAPDDIERDGIRNRFLHVWGATVVTLVHMYDPAVVILSGGILRAGAAVQEPIEMYVRSHLWPSITVPRFIVPPEPELSVVRGLSVLARSGDTRHTQEEQ